MQNGSSLCLRLCPCPNVTLRQHFWPKLCCKKMGGEGRLFGAFLEFIKGGVVGWVAFPFGTAATSTKHHSWWGKKKEERFDKVGWFLSSVWEKVYFGKWRKKIFPPPPLVAPGCNDGGWRKRRGREPLLRVAAAACSCCCCPEEELNGREGGEKDQLGFSAFKTEENSPGKKKISNFLVFSFSLLHAEKPKNLTKYFVRQDVLPSSPSHPSIKEGGWSGNWRRSKLPDSQPPPRGGRLPDGTFKLTSVTNWRKKNCDTYVVS